MVAPTRQLAVAAGIYLQVARARGVAVELSLARARVGNTTRLADASNHVLARAAAWMDEAGRQRAPLAVCYGGLGMRPLRDIDTAVELAAHKS